MALDPGYLTATVAALAAGIGFAQWHTARTKLVLDLFEERLAVYNELINALRPVWAHGTASEADLAAFNVPALRAKFLFGSDVTDYLDGIRKHLIKLGYLASMGPKERAIQSNWPQQKSVANTSVQNFQEDFTNLTRPYMRIDAKLPLWRFFNR